MVVFKLIVTIIDFLMILLLWFFERTSNSREITAGYVILEILIAVNLVLIWS